MEKKNKIIIVALIIVIVALVAGIAMMLNGNNLKSNDVEAGEGMQVYDFDSAFTMVVKDDAKFLKTWNTSPLGVNKQYYNNEDNYLVVLEESDYFANNIDFFSTLVNDTNEYEHIDDNLNIVKCLNKSDKVDTGASEKHFDYKMGIVEGNKFIILYSDDLDSLKDMGNSIRINGA